jgi:hypothetical protein
MDHRLASDDHGGTVNISFHSDDAGRIAGAIVDAARTAAPAMVVSARRSIACNELPECEIAVETASPIPD